MTTQIRQMRADDWEAVRRIYAQGIATGNATLESEPPDWPAFDAARLPSPRLVACLDGKVSAFAALSPVSSRAVYRGVAENILYVDPALQRRGLGLTLLRGLLRRAAAAGFWTVQAAILVENQASIALHERAGYRRVGVRHALGQDPQGCWRDVLLMEWRSELR